MGAPPHMYRRIGVFPPLLFVTSKYSFNSPKSDCSSDGDCQKACTAHLLFERIV